MIHITKLTKSWVFDAVDTSAWAGVLSAVAAGITAWFGWLPATLIFIWLADVHLKNLGKWKSYARSKGWYK